MTVIIGMLAIMAVLFFVMGWINKYSWLASLIMVALAMSMYSVMMMIAIKANYMPAGFIGRLDEMYFLNIVKNRMGFFAMHRFFNISVGLYIFAMVNFVPVYFNHFGKYDLKRFIRRLPAVVFPLLYVWFYDRQTSYWFYNCISFNVNESCSIIKVSSICVRNRIRAQSTIVRNGVVNLSSLRNRHKLCRKPFPTYFVYIISGRKCGKRFNRF